MIMHSCAWLWSKIKRPANAKDMKEMKTFGHVSVKKMIERDKYFRNRNPNTVKELCVDKCVEIF